MGSDDVSPRIDRWGEPVLQDAPIHPPRMLRVRVWWILAVALVAIGSVAASSALKRKVVASFAETCRQAHEARDWPALEPAAQRWLAWEPGKAEPLLYLAEATFETAQYDRAAEALGQMPDGDPRTPKALLERSSLLFDVLNRPIEAAQTLERAIRLDPRHVEARRRLVFFYAFTLQRRKMVEAAYDAIQYDCDLPETYVYVISRDWMSFANGYDQNTKWMQSNPQEELFLVARAIYRITARGLDSVDDPREDGPRAPDGTPYHRQVAAEYLERFPQNLEILAYHLERGVTTGDIDQVERLLARAPKASADDNRFWRCRGWLHAARDRLEEAEACYRKALEINRYDWLTRHQLAGVLRRLKRFDEVQTLERVSKEGKDLRRDILQLENVAKVPAEILARMAQHAANCGDLLVADKLAQRIAQWSPVWAAERAKAQGKPGPESGGR